MAMAAIAAIEGGTLCTLLPLAVFNVEKYLWVLHPLKHSELEETLLLLSVAKVTSLLANVSSMTPVKWTFV